MTNAIKKPVNLIFLLDELVELTKDCKYDVRKEHWHQVEVGVVIYPLHFIKINNQEGEEYCGKVREISNECITLMSTLDQKNDVKALLKKINGNLNLWVKTRKQIDQDPEYKFTTEQETFQGGTEIIPRLGYTIDDINWAKRNFIDCEYMYKEEVSLIPIDIYRPFYGYFLRSYIDETLFELGRIVTISTIIKWPIKPEINVKKLAENMSRHLCDNQASEIENIILGQSLDKLNWKIKVKSKPIGHLNIRSVIYFLNHILSDQSIKKFIILQSFYKNDQKEAMNSASISAAISSFVELKNPILTKLIDQALIGILPTK